MKVLVTGHRGYIVSVLAPLLALEGYDVVGLDTDYYAGCDFGSSLGAVRSLRRDVRDARPVDLTGFDAVVHLAALSNDPLGDLNEEWTHRINLDATLTLARAAREAGVRRFVFASSCSMYGASGTDDALDEEAPLRPLTPYAESKVRPKRACGALPTRASLRSRCATRRSTAPRPGCDSTSCSTTWRRGPIRPGRYVSSATARHGDRLYTCATLPSWRARCSRPRRSSSAVRPSTSGPTLRTIGSGS